MVTKDWIELFRILIDFLKTIVPYCLLLFIFFSFRDEVKVLINNGFKIVTPGGLLFDTYRKQQEIVEPKERKALNELNTKLKDSKQMEQKLKELQEYTAQSKKIFFMGYHFEKTYRLIFPSQMVIINQMTNYNNEISEPLAKSIFQRTVWAERFHIPFEQYMGFLTHSGLILYDSKHTKFVLTYLGMTFWKYLVGENIPLKIPANDFIKATVS